MAIAALCLIVQRYRSAEPETGAYRFGMFLTIIITHRGRLMALSVSFLKHAVMPNRHIQPTLHHIRRHRH